MKKQIYESLNALIDSQRIGVMATVIEGNGHICPAGSKFLVEETGYFHGDDFLEPVCFLVKNVLNEVFREKQPRIVDIVYKESLFKIFLDPIIPQERLIILGGGHIALPLVSIAKLLNYHVTVIDDRPEFAATGRFPRADLVVCQDFAEAVRETVFNQNTFIIIITRGHLYDKICLEEVLKKKQPAYVGMIGSKKKVSAILQELALLGYEKGELDSIHAPIGLDIGAQSPEEIALSIMAEVVMVCRYGFSVTRTMKEGADIGY